MIKKAYFEITNVCNLSCSFCPGNKRKSGFISVENFRTIASKLSGRIPYLYLHLMGEPTIHPKLPEILGITEELGFKVIITTNGTTLREKEDTLCSFKCIHKISISLHSFEANVKEKASTMEKYLGECFEFCRKASQNGIICVMRLWNLDGEDTLGCNSENDNILAQMKQYFGDKWADTRSGKKVSDKIFLEYGERFDWPDPEMIKRYSTEDNEGYFCHGLRDQIGILWNGSVVPCCLDSEGSIVLGNLLESSLEEILESEKAKYFYDCFSARKAPHPLCKTCGYAKRFKR